MNKEKTNHERKVFTDFAVAASLNIAPGSIHVCTPPKPDIRCCIGNCIHYFELGRILDAESPKLRLEMLRHAPLGVKPDLTKFGWPERDILVQKIRKSYETGGAPVYLVLYWDFDQDNWLTFNEPPSIVPFHIIANDLLLPLIREPDYPFSHTVYYHRRIGKILWQYPEEAQPHAQDRPIASILEMLRRGEN